MLVLVLALAAFGKVLVVEVPKVVALVTAAMALWVVASIWYDSGGGGGGQGGQATTALRRSGTAFARAAQPLTLAAAAHRRHTTTTSSTVARRAGRGLPAPARTAARSFALTAG